MARKGGSEAVELRLQDFVSKQKSVPFSGKWYEVFDNKNSLVYTVRYLNMLKNHLIKR